MSNIKCQNNISSRFFNNEKKKRESLHLLKVALILIYTWSCTYGREKESTKFTFIKLLEYLSKLVYLELGIYFGDDEGAKGVST